MAKFREMRKFVRFVKEEHLVMTEDDEVAQHVRRTSNSEFEWPNADEIRDKYAASKEIDTKMMSDICDDCINFHYLRYGSRYVTSHDYPLIVTYKGRHLLMKLGLIREIAVDNSDWLNATVAFIVGVLVASTPFIIFYISHGKSH